MASLTWKGSVELEGAGFQVPVDRGGCVDAVEQALGHGLGARGAKARFERRVRGDVEELESVRVSARNVHHVDVGELVLGCCAELFAGAHGRAVHQEENRSRTEKLQHGGDVGAVFRPERELQALTGWRDARHGLAVEEVLGPAARALWLASEETCE